ncbi:MAG: NAD-dependent epimerase/dehydratase family protein [Elusimicrobiota bacterium]
MSASGADFWKGKGVLVTGGAGFVGSHLVEKLLERGARVRVADLPGPLASVNLAAARDRVECLGVDLMRRDDCDRAAEGMEIVLNLAAKVGGIAYNQSHQGTMFQTNSLLALNMLEASSRAGVERHLVVSSACVYGRDATIPTPESEGFLGDPEASNFGYGWAKRLAEVQARAYSLQYGLRVAIARPFNAYGPRDRFDETGHVIASIIRRACAGETPLTVWGTGRPTRSFLYVDDFVDGLMLVTEKHACAEPVNLCDGTEVRICELAAIVARVVGLGAPITYDRSKPDGQPCRVGDTALAARLGFHPRVGLEEGIAKTVAWYRSQA